MKGIIRIASVAVAALVLSSAAMAQQGGGGGRGGGGGSGGSEGGGGDTSVIELRLQDHERAMRALRRAEGRSVTCTTRGCNEPPPARIRHVISEGCAGGEMWLVRDRYGSITRVICERW